MKLKCSSCGLTAAFFGVEKSLAIADARAAKWSLGKAGEFCSTCRQIARSTRGQPGANNCPPSTATDLDAKDGAS